MKNWKTNITDAHNKIRQHIRKTPVIMLENFIENTNVELKLEQFQHTGSFKVRGAFNAIISKTIPNKSVTAASGGNHGAAVAYASSMLKYNCNIFVPNISNPAKIELIKKTGVQPNIVKGNFSDALNESLKFVKQSNSISIHAYDDKDIISGQGTLFKEWEEQGLSSETMLIAVGGGGLISGALAWFGNNKRIVSVEPENSCALYKAIQNNNPLDVEVSGIAADALGAKKIGNHCFDLAKQKNFVSVLVTDESIKDAQKFLWNTLRIAVEPAGATSIAAILSGAYKPKKNERVSALICGANFKLDFC